MPSDRALGAGTGSYFSTGTYSRGLHFGIKEGSYEIMGNHLGLGSDNADGAVEAAHGPVTLEQVKWINLGQKNLLEEEK
jgi:hypothetical protein